MEFRDLSAQYQVLRMKIDEAVARTMCDSHFIGGEPVRELEQQLAKYVGVKHCISCGNGTDALQLALMTWEIGPGDAVIVPDFTFFSSGEVVAAVGATPIFVDVDKRTFNIDPTQIEPACRLAVEEGLKPKAVVTVDLFGLPADYSLIKAICDRLKLLVLEDAAQGFGGSIHETMACSFGDISTTSFFPAKPLGCYGDGGAIFTDNDEWAVLLRSYAVHGKGSMKYDNVRIGMNSRLDTIQAAILQVKLDAFVHSEVDAVNEVAQIYTDGLRDFAEEVGLTLPFIPDGFRSSWAQYTVQLPCSINRSRLQKKLREHDVPTMVYYPKPMHEQKAFAGKSFCLNGCPVTAELCKTVLSLPMGPFLENQDEKKVIREVIHMMSSERFEMIGFS